MHKYFAANVWQKLGDCPSTSKSAVPTEYSLVNNKRVVLIKNGTYRNASISGYFAVADAEPKTVGGVGVIEVYCLWFGHRLKTRGIHIKCRLQDVMFIDSYSDKVVSNLGHKNAV